MQTDGRIIRDPKSAQDLQYDLVIIGGGIYGAMLALESTRRGLRPLLVERADFGGETSFNSLRIVHGGLRYLQKLDLHRFRESVGERQWFLKTFPQLVSPLPCLMPLYGQGFHRPAILKTALKLNDGLSRNRNQGVPAANHLPNSAVLGIEQTRLHFPDVAAAGLKGAAKWHDAVMLNSQRILIEVLKWACRLGATVLNYVEARELLTNGSSACGIRAVDQLDSSNFRFRAPVVVNAAGPWCRHLAASYHKDLPRLFHPSLAFNLLLDHPPLSDHALAVCPEKNKGHTYFLVPWHDKLFAGTGHTTFQWQPGHPVHPSREQLNHFLSDLNSAVPGMRLKSSDIIHVHAGMLPVTHPGATKLTVREIIVDHGAVGGPKGLYSISGIKFTTARLVAEKALRLIAPARTQYTPTGKIIPDLHEYEKNRRPLLNSNGKHPIPSPVLKTIIQEESVCRPDDVIFRRTSLYEKREHTRELAPEIMNMMPSYINRVETI